jgi:hypothetical protein
VLVDEDFDTIATYWDVLAEINKADEPGLPDPKDGAATLIGLSQQYPS